MTLRLYAYLACAIAIAGFMAYGVHLKHKADKYDEAKAALADERKDRAAEQADTAKKLAVSEAERKAYSLAAQAIAQRFSSIEVPSPKTLIKTVEVPGACPRIGVNDVYVGLWNEASRSAN